MSIQIKERSIMNLKNMCKEVVNFFTHELKIDICSKWTNNLHGDNFEQKSTMKLKTGQVITITEPYVIYDGPFHYTKNTLVNINYFSGAININNLKEYTPIINHGDITIYLRKNIDEAIKIAVKIAQENNEWIKNIDAQKIMYESIGSNLNINVNFIEKIHSQNPKLTLIELYDKDYQTIIKDELTKLVIKKYEYELIDIAKKEKYLNKDEIENLKLKLIYIKPSSKEEIEEEFTIYDRWETEEILMVKYSLYSSNKFLFYSKD